MKLRAAAFGRGSLDNCSIADVAGDDSAVREKFCVALATVFLFLERNMIFDSTRGANAG